MLKLKLIRTPPISKKQMFTDGDMLVQTSTTEKYLDFSFTLEDKTRDINKNGVFDGDEKKVYGETAIPFSPPGKPYKGRVTWSPKFKRMLPMIFNVSEFEGIRIHRLNNVKQSLGCIGVGYGSDHKGKIWKSADAEIDLVNLIMANDENGDFTIEII